MGFFFVPQTLEVFYLKNFISYVIIYSFPLFIYFYIIHHCLKIYINFLIHFSLSSRQVMNTSSCSLYPLA